jgi:catechol 2,3-dioxygenase-like lactoylglutathione lyase family enzyme
MASIESVTLEVADPTAVNHFYTAALGLGTLVRRVGDRIALSRAARRTCTTAAGNPGARGHR